MMIRSSRASNVRPVTRPLQDCSSLVAAGSSWGVRGAAVAGYTTRRDDRYPPVEAKPVDDEDELACAQVFSYDDLVHIPDAFA